MPVAKSVAKGLEQAVEHAHTICGNCNQPRSQHSAKFGRCPSWATSKPSTFVAAKQQPTDPVDPLEGEVGPVYEDTPPSDTAREVANAFPVPEAPAPAAENAIRDEEPDFEHAEETVGRLARELGVAPASSVPDEDDRDDLDDEFEDRDDGDEARDLDED